MKIRVLATLIGISVGGSIAMEAVPARAQIDYLGNHLESIREQNLRDHQQRMLRGSRKKARKRTRRRVVPQIQVNGKPLKSPVAAIEVSGNTFVPFREIFEALGAKVTYNDQARVVMAERGSSVLQLPLQGNRAKINDRAMRIRPGQMPFVHQGVTMVPLRLVSEGMGAQITRVNRPTGPLIKISR